ncbi:hypothetical protein QT381_06425 [Galbitalea sp. SE-J8]|uniref:hypothetical protein n=1 Tax=Galbitalea sp. SE-J8 TaxID=3054952 RepID=UPI00259D23E9|nr:hypothetical protein [Galbitalea sp. SE-J8]MDM4762638.1 hypothetical protein [Galbitalea sp. SE-J8]
MHLRSALLPIVSVLAAATIVAASAAPASAATNPAGADVSAPQCSANGTGAGLGLMPPGASFVVVGVNAGIATTTNPCLGAQAGWAAGAPGGIRQPAVAYYLNTANPALAGVWWPDGNVTQPAAGNVPRQPVSVANPYGACAHDASAACAYVYGYSIARDDATARGVAAGRGTRWWLDVETANTWQADRVANRAALEGMTAALTSTGGTVGIYSTPAHWAEVVGAVPASSRLAALPSWRALGPVSRSAAVRACGLASFTPSGRLEITQYVSGGFDHDVECYKLSSAPTPKVSGTLRVGRRLTAKVTAWKPAAVTLSYRWSRDGTPIAHATKKAYLLKKADAGHRITLTVTGKKTGYSTIVKTSKAKRVAR